jgi:hypothetical protein
VDDWPDLLIRLAFTVAILGVAWLFCREWRRWRETREDDAVNEQEPGRKIGHRVFNDGVAREVFEDADGRQFVLSDTDERVYGHRLPPADEPHIAAGG